MRYYNFCLLKAWFEKGYGLTNYIKYIIALFGLSSLNVKATLIMGLVYGLSCFLIGWVWYHYKFIEAEHEVNNRVNPFVKEMRSTYKRTTFI